MARIYLPDTNTFSRFFRNATKRLEGFFEQTPSSLIRLSVVVEGELRYGLAKKQWEQTKFGKIVRSTIDHLEKSSWTSETAKAYGGLRATAERNGITVATVDLMIAAQAKEFGYVLVTNDQALHRLTKWIDVEDWI